MSDSLRLHGLQHARPPCPSPTPRVYSNSCPLSRWWHPTISSSVVPFSSHLQSFPESGSFFFNLFFLLYFNWRLLLYNIVLVLPYINMNPPRVYTCSQSGTPLPPPSPYYPSGSLQCTSPEHPVSCIEPELAIRFTYDIIHASMPFSQIIPPSPFPTESKRLFVASLSGFGIRVMVAS